MHIYFQGRRTRRPSSAKTSDTSTQYSLCLSREGDREERVYPLEPLFVSVFTVLFFKEKQILLKHDKTFQPFVPITERPPCKVHRCKVFSIFQLSHLSSILFVSLGRRISVLQTGPRSLYLGHTVTGFLTKAYFSIFLKMVKRKSCFDFQGDLTFSIVKKVE